MLPFLSISLHITESFFLSCHSKSRVLSFSVWGRRGEGWGLMYVRRGGGHCFDRSACRCDGRRESRGQTADIYFSDSIRHVHAGRASDPEPAQCVYKWGRIYCEPQEMTAWRKLFVYNQRVSVCWVTLENKYLTVMYSYKIQSWLPFNNASLLAPSRMYKCFPTQRVHTSIPHAAQQEAN